MIPRRMTALLAGSLAAFTALPAIAQQAESTLRWSSRAAITDPDPYYNAHREAMILNGHLVWDTLIYRDLESGKYEPLLAKSWQWVDDTTLEFVLRDDVTFHDGSKFDSADVVYTYNYISNPDNKINVQSTANWIDRAEAVDEYTVRVFLKRPFPAALEYVSTLHSILPEGFYGENNRADLSKITGTGPYKFTEFVPGSVMRVERSDSYIADGPKGNPQLEAIEYRTLSDPATQMAELLSGGIDWVWYVPSDQAKSLGTYENIKVLPGETMRFNFISFNLRDGKEVLKDPRFRQAVAHAIDRETIVSQIVGAGSNVQRLPCFRTQFGCPSEVKQYDYDPEKAKALLAEAGYNGEVIDLLGHTLRDRAWVEALQYYLTRVGINVNAEHLPYTAYSERVSKGQVDLNLADWGSYGINDVSALWNNHFTGSSDDITRDAEVTEALETAAVTIDEDTRRESYFRVGNRLAEELFWFPLWSMPTTYAFDQKLQFESYPDEDPKFYRVSWGE